MREARRGGAYGSGWGGDLLIANFVVGPRKLARLLELSRTADPIVAVDHADQLLPIAAAFAEAGTSVRIVIEVDIGLGRPGVQPGDGRCTSLGEAAALHGVSLVGLMGRKGTS